MLPNANKIIAGMGVLIALYLVGRFGVVFDSYLAGTRTSGGGLFGFLEEETATLQGNPPFAVYR